MSLLTSLLAPGLGNASSGAGLLADRDAAAAGNAGHLYFATDVNGGTLYRSNGTSWVQVALGVSEPVFPQFAYKTADETVNNSTVAQDDDALSVSVDADAVYVVDAVIIYNSSSTADLKLQWSTLPTGAAFNWFSGGSATEGTAGSNNLDLRARSTVGPFIAEGFGADVVATPRGLLRMGGTAGTLTFRWAQWTAAVSDTTVKAGSWLRAARVA